jgi:uncharacterized RDD family membrane protein YckC
MSESYAEMLKANYENMHTDILIETKIKGGLTEVAQKLLEEELQKRNVSEKDESDYKTSDVANIKPEDFAEGITLGNLASTGSRYVAQFVDQVIAVLIVMAVSFLIGIIGLNTAFGLVLVVSSYAAYILMNDAMPNGQSIGKKLLSIKVINKESGKNCSLSESFLRNITTVIPFLAVIDALLIFGVKKQRMGDKIANTLVVNA